MGEVKPLAKGRKHVHHSPEKRDRKALAMLASVNARMTEFTLELQTTQAGAYYTLPFLSST